MGFAQERGRLRGGENRAFGPDRNRRPCHNGPAVVRFLFARAYAPVLLQLIQKLADRRLPFVGQRVIVPNARERNETLRIVGGGE